MYKKMTRLVLVIFIYFIIVFACSLCLIQGMIGMAIQFHKGSAITRGECHSNTDGKFKVL